MIKNICLYYSDTLYHPSAAWQSTNYQANKVVTRIRREQLNYLLSEHIIDKVYISFDLQLLLVGSSLLPLFPPVFQNQTNSGIVGFLWNIEVHLDYSLEGLQFHFNDLTLIRHSKINSILEDSKAEELTIYQIEFVNHQEI